LRDKPLTPLRVISKGYRVLDPPWIFWYREQKGKEGTGMKKEIIVSEKLSKPLGIYSEAVKAEGGRMLFISG
jgi:hypothetical protein